MRELKVWNLTRITELFVQLLFFFVYLFYTKFDYSKLYKYVDLEANRRLMYKFGPEGFWYNMPVS